MAHSSEQQRTLDAMVKEHGGIPSWYNGHIMTRDARLIPGDAPEYRGRKADPSCLNIESEDDPEPEKVTVEVQPAIEAKAAVMEGDEIKEPAVEAKAAVTRDEFKPRANDSALETAETIDVSPKKSE